MRRNKLIKALLALALLATIGGFSAIRPAQPAHAAHVSSATTNTGTTSGLPTTLATAQAKWPGAKISRDGILSHPGQYIVHLRDGHYTMRGMEVRRQDVSILPQAATGCYDIKQEVYTYQYVGFPDGYITFDTWNHTPDSCGSTAYGDTETPGCKPFPGGQCGSMLGLGWIGQGTFTVNAWLNWQPASASTVYCRTYFQANGNYWSWCSF